MEEPEDISGEPNAGAMQLDLLKSYLAFARRAIRARWLLAALVFAVGLALTVSVVIYFPRTYKCTTVMMALGSSVLDRNDTPNGLTGAEGLIMRHENLEGLIRTTRLIQTNPVRRPPLLKTKDRVIAALFGQPDEKTQLAILVGTLESKLEIAVEKGELRITVQWSDGQTAADLVEAARESFLNARHTAEVSAFEDKMAILDGHARRLREEVAALAEQMNASAQGGPRARPSASASAGGPVAATPSQRPVVRGGPRVPDALMLEELSTLREKLATNKPKLAELETDWARRMRDEQGKLAEMKLRLTPSHPEVVTQEQRVAMVSQVPGEIAQLRTTVATLETGIRARELGPSRGVGGTATAGGAANAEPLPTEILQALEKNDTDPALRAQLSGAVIKYGDLRDGIRSSRIDLDTAQAAFNHRYQVIVPAEAPSKPIKPKPALIFVGGLVISLLLALALPILGELRKGLMIEQWQVEHLQLPVLADLKLPPHAD